MVTELAGITLPQTTTFNVISPKTNLSLIDKGAWTNQSGAFVIEPG
jgi:hypothetical protein